MKPARANDDSLTELGRLFEEALRCLESTDLYGANAALKKVHAEAVLSRGDAGSPRTVVTNGGVTPVGPRNGERARGSGAGAYGLLAEKGAAGRGTGPLARLQGETEKLNSQPPVFGGRKTESL